MNENPDDGICRAEKSNENNGVGNENQDDRMCDDSNYVERPNGMIPFFGVCEDSSTVEKLNEINDDGNFDDSSHDKSDEEINDVGSDDGSFHEHGDDFQIRKDFDPIKDCEVTPMIGMTFANVEEGRLYYNLYSRKVGFSMRIKRTNKNRGGEISRQDLCCSCEGTYEKKGSPRKRRDSKRFGCRAMLQLRRRRDGKFEVSKFVEQHNHHEIALQPDFLRSHWEINPSQKKNMKRVQSTGPETSQPISNSETEAGRSENMNFIQFECNRFVQKEPKNFLKKGDAQFLVAYFERKKKENKFFFYSMRMNEDNEISAIFFSEAKSRRDYGLFGDVLCFDTTYKSNKNNMIYAPFVGVNSHGQSILFGCGLLDDETADSFLWLFKTFLEAVGGKPPKTIFTDQGMSISNGISEVFEESYHRISLWHVSQKVATSLSHVYNDEFSTDFKRCIHDSESVAEFEASWLALLEKYKLEGNDCMGRLYALREKWAHVYGQVYFSAGIATAQGSENTNNFLKKFFVKNLMLRQFMDHYDTTLSKRKEEEKLAEHVSRTTKPILLSSWGVEDEASKMYTRKIFYMFQNEFKGILDLKCEFESDDGSIRTYSVIDMEGREKKRTVTYFHSDHSLTCSCKKFELQGVLCSHALKVFRELGISSLLSQYYLQRWSREATNNVVFDLYGEVIQTDIDPLFTARYSQLSHATRSIIAKGAKSTALCSLVMSGIIQLESMLDSFVTPEEGL